MLKNEIEAHGREVLCCKFEVAFASKELRLTTGGSHEFDAVSTDDRIVASIKSASDKTSNGKYPAGKIKDAEAELYYLTLVSAHSKSLVLTDPQFFERMKNRLKGKLPQNIKLRLIPLSSEMQEQVDIVRKKASDEMSRG